jgi:ribosomal protein S18 acetylase RimI-like enzyme
MNILPIEQASVTTSQLLAVAGVAAEGRTGLERAIADGNTRMLVSRNGEKVTGAAAWTRLPWDSDLFGFAAGKVQFLSAGEESRQELCSALLEDVRGAGIRHLVARVDAGDLATAQTLEGAGFVLIDAIQTFAIKTPRSVRGATADCLVRDYRSTDLEELCAIARTAYRYDRFHADSALSPGVADRVHEEWVRNSCLGKPASHVVVAEADGRIAGYVTCKVNSTVGTIELVATAEFARGRGVGRAATRRALRWFGRNGAETVEVGTQLRNIPAGRLYESCGFRLKRASLTLRKVL